MTAAFLLLSQGAPAVSGGPVPGGSPAPPTSGFGLGLGVTRLGVIVFLCASLLR